MAKKVTISVASLLVAVLLGIWALLPDNRSPINRSAERRAAVGDVHRQVTIPETASAQREADSRAAEESDSEHSGARRRLLDHGGWTIKGRIVRLLGQDMSGPKEPVKGAVVLLDSRPDSLARVHLPIHRRVTPADGRFEFAGVPGRNERFRLAIDVPGCAYRTVSFFFDDPARGGDEWDFGDLVVYPGADLRFRLIGPEGEPIGGATVEVALEKANPRRGWHPTEMRQLAIELGDGDYVLKRASYGEMTVRILARGYAPYKSGFLSPLEEVEGPVLIQLDEGHRIGGQVTSFETREPLPGAVVIATDAYSLSATTDEEGRFLLDWLAAGSHELRVTAAGHVTLERGGFHAGTLDNKIALQVDAALRGIVLEESNGAPVAGARVALHSTDSARGDEYRFFFEALTDVGGRFHIAEIGAGSYTLVVDHDKFATKVFDEYVGFAAGEDKDVGEIRLVSGLKATGTVVDASTQESISGARVAFRLKSIGVRDDVALRIAETAEDGTFELVGLGEGDYFADVGVRGYLEKESEVISMASAGVRALTFSLDRGSSISGHVVGPSGDRIANARITVSLNTESVVDWLSFRERFRNLYRVSALTDGEGRFALHGLRPHPGYALEAIHSSFAPGRVESIRVEPGAALSEIRITLQIGGGIRGSVVDETGHGLPGVVVSCRQKVSGSWHSRNVLRKTSTDRHGHYVLEPLAAGSYEVRTETQDTRKYFVPAVDHGVEVVDGETTYVELVLREGAVVSGRIVDSRGQGVPRALVLGPHGVMTNTSKEGNFELSGLTPGKTNIAVMAEGFVQPHGEEVLVPRERLLITLEKYGVMRGVVQAEEETLPPFRVIAVDSMGRERGNARRNGSSGEFELTVAAGTYSLVAFVKGYAPSASKERDVGEGEVVDGVVIEMIPGASIAGQVTSLSGGPIPGATIRLVPSGRHDRYLLHGNLETVSSDDGAYRLEDLPAGLVTVRVEHVDFADKTIEGVRITGRGETSLAVVLGRGGELHGIVHRSGEPVLNAAVEIRQLPPGGYHEQVPSDARGRFEMQRLEPGAYTATAHEGTITRRAEFSVYEGRLVSIELDFGGAVILSGNVRAAGRPVGEGRIGALYSAHGFSERGVSIDPFGNYSLSVDGPGVHTLVVWFQGSSTRVSLEVPSGVGQFDYDIDLPAGEVVGVVVDAVSGQAVSRASVAAFPAEAVYKSYPSLYAARRCRTAADDSGRFRLAGLPAGDHSLRFGARGYSETALEVFVEEGSRVGAGEVSMNPGGPFAAEIRDEEGRPVHGARTILRDARGELVTTSELVTSDDLGEARLEGILPGSYRLTVIHDEFAPSILNVSVTEDRSARAVVTLRRGLPLQMFVVEESGRPVERAEVLLFDPNGDNVLEDLMDVESLRPKNLTDVKGSLAVEHVSPSTYTTYARHGARQSERLRVIASSESSRALILRFSAQD